MTYFLAIAGTGLSAILLHPLRSLTTVVSVVAVLLPYLVGMGLSRGLEEEAEISIRAGADLYVTGIRFGRAVPIPLQIIPEIRKIEGVTKVFPRIVGKITLGKDQEPVVMVGIPMENLPSTVTCIQGRPFRTKDRNEFIIGTELARRLGLKVGSIIPPFYRNDRGEKVSEVVGIFQSDVSPWQAHLILTSQETASAVFNQSGLATEILVYCAPEEKAEIRSRIFRELGPEVGKTLAGLGLQITDREDVRAVLSGGLEQHEGIFQLLYVLAFSVAILVIMVTSGFGQGERRREIGILKATGWQTDEILLRSGVETFLLSLAGASLAVVLAFIWLKWFNGWWIAGIFLEGASVVPTFRVPYRLTPVPALLGFLISFVVTVSGTLLSSWRAAITAPMEAMR